VKSITKAKPLEELAGYLEPFNRIYILGCGTCATMTGTGGVDQVVQMKEHVQEMNKWVTGWLVMPTACDEMAPADMERAAGNLDYADCALAMSCAMGVHRAAESLQKPVIPALDTLFVGLEEEPGHFREVCDQCGQCVLGETAGICPLTACHKGLLNGPCGGTDGGKCEVDSDRDCAFTVIYERLKAQGRLDLMRGARSPRNYHVTLSPRRAVFNDVHDGRLP